MDKKYVTKKLNKIYEDIGGGMVSSAAGLPGIEGGMEKKKKDTTKKDLTTIIQNNIQRA